MPFLLNLFKHPNDNSQNKESQNNHFVKFRGIYCLVHIDFKI